MHTELERRDGDGAESVSARMGDSYTAGLIEPHLAAPQGDHAVIHVVEEGAPRDDGQDQHGVGEIPDMERGERCVTRDVGVRLGWDQVHDAMVEVGDREVRCGGPGR